MSGLERKQETPISPDWLLGGGQTGDLVRSIDWASTPLGPRKTWPQSLRTIVNVALSSSLPMVIHWGSDSISIYNDHCLVIAGDKHPQAMGRPHRETWPELWSFHQPIFERVMVGGEAVCLEDQLFRLARHGCIEEAYFTISYGPIYTEANQVGGILVTLLETTQRVALERRLTQEKQTLSSQMTATLHESEERFKLCMEATNDGLWDWSILTDKGYFSPAYYRILGYQPEEFAPTGANWAKLIHPDDLQHTMDANLACVDGRCENFEVEYRMQAKDGGWRWILGRGRCVSRDEHGRATRLVGTHVDITQRKLAEEGLAAAKSAAQQAQAAAEEASRAKDHFLAVLSHELRTPLTPVLPVLEDLAQRVPEAVREDLEMARRNVELEARLIDDLLDVTRISRGKIELHREASDLETIVRRAAEVCMPDIEARRLCFSIRVDGGPFPVYADPARVQQVFWNLIKNAIKFTAHGGSVDIHCHRSGDDHVLVEVRDSGIGIESDVLLRIFNAFEQGDRTMTRQFGGLGLGLAISKALVELHGGTVQAYSEGRGKGATFTVQLPIYQTAEKTLSPQAQGPAVSPQVATPIRPLEILLVEDHGDTARVMRRMLQSKGHRVEIAGDAATAMELASERSFDLIVSDLGLPDRTGLELLGDLHQMGQHIPSIALSGYGQEEDIRRSREAGFREHLTKPVSLGQLEAAIGRVVAE